MFDGYNGHKIVDDNVIGYSPLMSPRNLKDRLPLTDRERETVVLGRRYIRDILDGGGRKLLVVGPCSISDPVAARDYAERLRGLAEDVHNSFVTVMRMYGEKPRTSIGWKGLINEPYLDGQENINAGLRIAREMLITNAGMGLPSGTEFLDTFTPQYIGDLTSWAAIGARTTESQQHREMASGLSMTVGFKNGTNGNTDVAVNAVLSARHPHHFFGLDQDGVPSIVATRGNPYTHIVLRGGDGSTNYDRDSVQIAQHMLRRAGLSERLMIDCSHGNSGKDYRQQPVVFEDVIRQIVDGNNGIIGMMLESNLYEGSQKIPEDPGDLRYGVSVTDSCIGWETTANLIRDAHRSLSRRVR
ncbi:MAG: 3-deoxy-7-phosphoheptulonate synthase [Candidatus Aenigmarchaeota archaeon]|nr:3-deoxy-7-phosphoheptulonate synthase [Candidatus Aenigmarchaeota archaeon]